MMTQLDALEIVLTHLENTRDAVLIEALDKLHDLEVTLRNKKAARDKKARRERSRDCSNCRFKKPATKPCDTVATYRCELTGSKMTGRQILNRCPSHLYHDEQPA